MAVTLRALKPKRSAKASDAKAHFTRRDVPSFLGHDQGTLLYPKGRRELAHVRAFRKMVVKGRRAEASRKADILH